MQDADSFTNQYLGGIRQNPLYAALIMLAFCLFLSIQPAHVHAALGTTALSKACAAKNVTPSEDGLRRLALIVGAGQYKSAKIPDLPGPPQDARRFYQLLTGPNGYGFPKENVCVLVDEAATTANFKRYFSNFLIEQAQPNDEVVIYYAGHGSQTRDRDGDEPDGMDETFVFHDARDSGIKDFTDDEFDELLTRLHQKTSHITVFLDSCNSGTALRGDTEFLSRYIPPPETETTRERSTAAKPATNGQKTGWISKSLPGIVVFTAAGDGTVALERNARGIFTDAILTTFGQVNATQLTYAQAARQIRPLVKAESYQIPYFQGDLQRTVFAGVNRKLPLAWEIIEIAPQLKLGGFPLPGIDTGAEFRVYDGFVKGPDLQDPTKAKAVIIVEESTRLNATARIISRPANAKPIRPGDLAILSRPSDAQRTLKVTLRPHTEQGGISAEQASLIGASLNQNQDAKNMIQLVEDNGIFEISYENDQYIVSGPENRVRNRFAKADGVIENLRLHALQRVLSTLRGEGGSLFEDQETLQVQLVPADKQDQCAQKADWRQAPSNTVSAQEIPLCYKWNVKVKLSEKSPVRLLVGGLILSTDGSIFGLPADGTAIPLGPGEEAVFAAKGETFIASEPLNIEDQIVVFGTQETNPVPWSLLTQSAVQRAGDTKSGLYKILDQYLKGTRGVSQPVETDDTDTAWTKSSITMRVTDPGQ
ncbi:Caspase domain-containing protein [Nitrosomonas sp. Nm51]|nr:Caspase domain-containing protein [Nitrosomonas sp. Nm51]